MNQVQTAAVEPVRVPANHAVTRRLGNWTDARRFEVRAHHGRAVLDLRSPRIPAGDVRLEVDLDHAVLTVLVAADVQVDDWDLRREGRGRVKDAQRADLPGGRRVVVAGHLRNSEIRVRRAGDAILSAMFSREYLADLRRSHRRGELPTVDDPTRTA